MFDTIYNSADVSQELHPIFDQIVNEFGEQYEIWRRVEDFGRKVSAGILNRETNIAVTVTILDSINKRQSLLNANEIQRIRDHLLNNHEKDLEL